LIDPPIDTVAAALPTANGNPYTLARGWMWAVSSPDPDRQLASVKLAEFLSEGNYLGQWTALAGYLPTRSSALASWPASPLRALISQLVLSAEIVPGTEFTTVLSPALQEATIQVLKQQLDPDSAAKEAANSVTAP
jgi:ABC-type glycerol-3-phosphate transport system substrate-binding protein